MKFGIIFQHTFGESVSPYIQPDNPYDEVYLGWLCLGIGILALVIGAKLWYKDLAILAFEVGVILFFLSPVLLYCGFAKLLITYKNGVLQIWFLDSWRDILQFLLILVLGINAIVQNRRYRNIEKEDREA